MTIRQLLIFYDIMATVWVVMTGFYIVTLWKTRRALLEFKKSSDEISEHATKVGDFLSKMRGIPKPIFMGELHPDEDGNINIGELVKAFTGDGGKPN